MLLADEILEFFRTHPLRQRAVGVVSRFEGRRIEQAHISIRWRRASYSSTPAATAAFNDSTVEVGIFNPMARACSPAPTPRASFPMTIAQRPDRFASETS